MSALTPKQLRFVEEYLVDLNGTQAAIRAGYTPRTAESQASRLLRNAKVAAAVAEAQRARTERVEVRQDDVLRELMRIALLDLGQAFDPDGNLLAVEKMPESVRRAIAAIEVRVDENGDVVKKLKFWDKPRSLELLGKHLKMWTDKVEHTADSSFAELLKAARERARRG